MTVIADVEAAHDATVALIHPIPDAALDWQPDSDTWSLKQIIGHLAHAHDFYVTIVEEARAAHFGILQLHTGLAGWQRMADTDAAVAHCTTTQAVLGCFEQTYQRMLAILHSITPEECQRPFVFQSWQSNAKPLTTTLQQRVIEMVASHMHEHQPQLLQTLASWQSLGDGD